MFARASRTKNKSHVVFSNKVYRTTWLSLYSTDMCGIQRTTFNNRLPSFVSSIRLLIKVECCWMWALFFCREPVLSRVGVQHSPQGVIEFEPAFFAGLGLLGPFCLPQQAVLHLPLQAVSLPAFAGFFLLAPGTFCLGKCSPWENCSPKRRLVWFWFKENA